ncbi:hypothetical protein H5410_061183 [Solanum commersonii]|uniref:Reverse transcriptase zinc-binding domain-containing protein n=1 Tax=Solanum commersonii TaxID=4109 RepID=A0A9J5W7F5_SOLCO|nr:hypothetical protein H5410_061183 [Solanum commersonii]
MAKTYDRVDWNFLIRVLEQMVFDNLFVDKIWRLIANNWFFVLINGQARDFFHSSRGGVKKYQSYADDTIIFATADQSSLQLIMQILGDCEKQSGQKINKEKIHLSTNFAFEDVKPKLLGLFTFGATPVSTRHGCGVGSVSDLVNQLWTPASESKQLSEKQLRSQRTWNDNLLNHLFSKEVCNHIIEKVGCEEDTDEWDKLWWMAHNTGKFDLNSAWEILRNAKASNWGISNKNSPLVDDVRCCCFETLATESYEHLFITCPVATTLWKAFEAVAVWKIWKRRNMISHGGK